MGQEPEEQDYRIKRIEKEEKVQIIQKVKLVLRKDLVLPPEEVELKMSKIIPQKELPEVGQKIIDKFICLCLFLLYI